VLDALLLAMMVDAHVSNYTQAQLRNFGELILELIAGKVLPNQFIELLDRISTEKCFNACIAKCDVDESFEKMGQVLSVGILHLFGLRVSNEGQDHELGNSTFNHALAAILVHRQAIKGPG